MVTTPPASDGPDGDDSNDNDHHENENASNEDESNQGTADIPQTSVADRDGREQSTDDDDTCSSPPAAAADQPSNDIQATHRKRSSVLEDEFTKAQLTSMRQQSTASTTASRPLKNAKKRRTHAGGGASARSIKSVVGGRRRKTDFRDASQSADDSTPPRRVIRSTSRRRTLKQKEESIAAATTSVQHGVSPSSSTRATRRSRRQQEKGHTGQAPSTTTNSKSQVRRSTRQRRITQVVQHNDNPIELPDASLSTRSARRQKLDKLNGNYNASRTIAQGDGIDSEDDEGPMLMHDDEKMEFVDNGTDARTNTNTTDSASNSIESDVAPGAIQVIDRDAAIDRDTINWRSQNHNHDDDDTLHADENEGIHVEAELVGSDANGLDGDDRARIGLEVRQRILLEADEAQIIVTTTPGNNEPEQPDENEGKLIKGYCRLAFLCLGTFTMVAIIIFGALAASGQFQKFNASSNGELSQSPGTGIAVTTTPTMTSPASAQLSAPPSLQVQPSPAPTSSMPTDSPTRTPILIFDNYLKENAMPISLGIDNQIEGFFDAFLFDGSFHLYMLCDIGPSPLTAAGLWFSYQPTASMPVTAAINPGFQVHLFTFQGASPNVQTHCVNSALYTREYRRVSWMALEGVSYYLLVVSEEALAEGNEFTLEVHDNSRWEDSYGPLAVAGPVPTVLIGSTTHLQAQTNEQPVNGIVVPECNSASEQTSPGAWYSVVGSGTRMSATTCGLSEMDSQISVLTLNAENDGRLDVDATTNHGGGGGASNWTCINGNDDSCASSQSQVSWESEAGALYYILVHGRGSEVGNFELLVSTFGDDPLAIPGDSCFNAIPADDVVFDAASLDKVPAQVDFTVATEGMKHDNACTVGVVASGWTLHGMWYRVSGNGQTLRMIPFGFDIFGYENVISILKVDAEGSTSTCGDLMCVIEDCSAFPGMECSWQTSTTDMFYIFMFSRFGIGYPDEFQFYIETD